MYAVIGAVFGEYVGAREGLGIWMQLSQNAFRTDLVFAAIVVTSALSLRPVLGSWGSRGGSRSRGRPASAASPTSRSSRSSRVGRPATARNDPRGRTASAIIGRSDERAATRGGAVADGRTIVFFPEGAYGPTNNCVGIGNVLRARGHRVVFIVEESFAGNLEAKGFEERLMRLGPPPEEPEIPGQFWIDFIRDTAPVFRKPTIEQLGEFIAPTFQALIDGAKYVQPRLEEIVDELEPGRDRRGQRRQLPGDHVDRPRRGSACCRATRPRSRTPRVAPFSSGYPAADRSAWPAFLDEVRPDARRAVDRLRRLLPRAGRWRPCRGTSTGPDFMHESPVPQPLLVPAPRPTTSGPRRSGPTWHQLDSTVRAADTTWQLPDALASRDGALIYLSLGQPRARRTSG